MNSWRLDCRYFLGDRPCKFKRSCPGCKEYSPMGQRILIVKLAASGDVLRTTPLLSGLKRAHPRAPCYRRSCQVAPNCMQASKAEEVMAKIRALLPQSQRTRRA